MTRKIGIILLALTLCVSLLVACGDSDILTTDEAQEIALKDAGLKKSDVSIHTHVGTEDGKPCYEVHIEAGAEGYTYLIDAQTGAILDKSEGVHE